MKRLRTTGIRRYINVLYYYYYYYYYIITVRFISFRRTVNVSFNKVSVVVVLLKNTFKIILATRGFASREELSRFTTWSLPCCNKTCLDSGKNITGATIGYNVAVANKNLHYYLRLPWRKKKQTNKQTRPNF